VSATWTFSFLKTLSSPLSRGDVANTVLKSIYFIDGPRFTQSGKIKEKDKRGKIEQIVLTVKTIGACTRKEWHRNQKREGIRRKGIKRLQECSGRRKTKKKREMGTKRKKERGQRNEATYAGMNGQLNGVKEGSHEGGKKEQKGEDNKMDKETRGEKESGKEERKKILEVIWRKA
jgi:hypothetical protein